MLPFADHLNGDVFRVYFGSRNSEQRAHTGFIELDITNPREILFETKNPVLSPGPIGHFDQHGAIGSSIVDVDGAKYMYYIGWTQGYKGPLFQAMIGLAISEDGGKTFKKYSRAPILPLNDIDPILMTSPHVFHDKGQLIMSYISGVKWEEIDGQLKSYYRVCRAHSYDGISWERNGDVIIDFEEEETNFARPWILKIDNVYHLWYALKTKTVDYRMGYAVSNDNASWERRDAEVGIGVSLEGFDSEMIEYPSIFKHGSYLYMLYNGNRFGYDGIGLARAKF